MVSSSIRISGLSFVRDLEVEVVASDTTTGNAYNEIRLSIDGDGDGQATDLGTILFRGKCRFWKLQCSKNEDPD